YVNNSFIPFTGILFNGGCFCFTLYPTRNSMFTPRLGLTSSAKTTVSTPAGVSFSGPSDISSTLIGRLSKHINITAAPAFDRTAFPSLQRSDATPNFASAKFVHLLFQQVKVFNCKLTFRATFMATALFYSFCRHL